MLTSGAIRKLIEEKIAKKLLQFIDGTLITNPRLSKKIQEGKGFIVGHRFTSVASGSSVDLLISNPSDSGKTVTIIAVEVLTFGRAWIDIYKDNTITTHGTSLTPRNQNLGSLIDSIVDAEYGGTYAVGTLIVPKVHPGGYSVRAIGSLSEVGQNTIIPPNHNLLIRVTNQDTASTDISISASWFEE